MRKRATRFYAHSASHRSRWEPLHEHLRRVGQRAGQFADVFGARREAEVAGLLHDLGKYSGRFLRRLEGLESGLDHWSLGAWVALTRFRERGIAAALAIEGHHVGLRSGSKESLRDLDPKSERWANPNERQLTLDDPRIALRHLQTDGLDIPDLDSSVYDSAAPKLSRMLDTRMLFSALVDADYVETEAHFAGDGEYRYRTEVAPLDLDSAIEKLARDIAALPRDASSKVQAVRDTLLKTCLDAALSPAGLFTLTAPTGSGKTLAMLAFALEHARHHGPLCQ